MNEKTYTLTRSEMAIMQVLWDMPTGGTIREILERFSAAQSAGEETEAAETAAPSAVTAKTPAYTTVATFLKILMNKGFVESRRAEKGKAQIFSCVITRAMYSRQMMRELKGGLFGGSFKRMVHYFVQEEDLSLDELHELLELIESTIEEESASR